MKPQTRSLSFLLLIACLGLYIACSNSSGTNDAASSSGSTTASPVGSVAAAVDLEPVMPEKVQGAFEQNCKSCHGPDGHGITSIAPDLRRAPRRNAKEWIANLKDQKGAHSQTKIPAMASLNEADYEAIGGYLADLTQNNPAAAVPKK